MATGRSEQKRLWAKENDYILISTEKKKRKKKWRVKVKQPREKVSNRMPRLIKNCTGNNSSEEPML